MSWYPTGMRWSCPGCGIVRDFPEAGPFPWCRHGDPMLPATEMEEIPMSHPLAIGYLPFDQSEFER